MMIEYPFELITFFSVTIICKHVYTMCYPICFALQLTSQTSSLGLKTSKQGLILQSSCKFIRPCLLVLLVRFRYFAISFVVRDLLTAVHDDAKAVFTLHILLKAFKR